ncbi:MAG: FAD-dependent oxidoreductase, partial [Gammaproteobacteria bacterium]
ARLCVRGRDLLYDFCDRFRVPSRRLGKLIVAQAGEEQQLAGIQARATANGVQLQPLDQAQLGRLEPRLQGKAALFSPQTGIVDSHQYMTALLHQARQHGAELALHCRVLRAIPLSTGGLELHTENGKERQAYRLQCDTVINAAGLQAQAVASTVQGLDQDSIPRLYPCKGDYFAYRGNSPVSRLVYPVPEPQARGLGIHCTLDLGGQLRFGPDSDYVDSLDYQVAPQKAALFASAVARYLPGITAEKLLPAYAGIRPKLAGPGQPQADFHIQDASEHGIAGLIQLFGIESPGLTASLALAEEVAARV